MPTVTSDLIQFKRGTSAALQTLITNKGGVDGCFYLTIDEANTAGAVKDSSKLYVGRADGSIVPVNQGITTVQSTTELVDGVAHGDLHAGDFAYVSGSNIFAIYDGTAWKQINSVGTDTFTESFSVALTRNSTSGAVTVTTQANLKDNNTNPTSAFTVVGNNGISTAIDNSTKTITLSGDPYTFGSSAASNNAATISLKHEGGNTSAGSVAVSSANANRLHVTGNANQIILDAPIVDTVQVAGLSAGGFGVQFTDTFSNSKSGTVDPTITYGKDNNQVVHFLSGNASLNVYTKDEVDQLKNALNAMTYKGTVGTGGSAATALSGLTGISNGDVFKVVGDGISLGSQAAGTITTAKAGDLLIAQGDEYTASDSEAVSNPSLIGTIKGTPKFDVVPSGDDIDTYYTGSAISHGWQIQKQQGAGSDLGSLSLAAGSSNVITLTDSGTGNNRIVTIEHGNVNNNAIAVSGSTSDVTKTDGASTSFEAITAINVNQQGHVTSVTKKKLTLAAENTADINAVSNTVAQGTKSATITTSAQMLKNNGSTGTAKSASFTISSDNLNVVANATNKDVKMNFVWGTF